MIKSGNAPVNGSLPPARPRATPAAERVCRVLRRAIGRVCPRDLRSLREDLVQSALLRVLERERKGEDKAIRSTSYLLEVAFTTTADEIRRIRRRKALDVHEQPGKEQERALEVSGPAQRLEAALAIRACVERLAEDRRAAVLLYLQGFSAHESARVLGCDRKRVQNLVFRGIHDLRGCLHEKGVGPR